MLCASCGKLVGVRDDVCWNCGRCNPALWGFAGALRRLGADLGFVPLVIWGCAALYVATLAVDPSGIGMGGLFSMLSPSFRSLFLFGASGAIPVFGYGRWWTVLSASWLHGGLLHIAFNILWLRQLAPAAAELYGAPRAVLIYTIAGIGGFLLSSFAGVFLPDLIILRGAQFTVGASAPIFGLLGALVAYGRRMSGAVGRQALTYAVVLGLFGVIMPGGGIDNYAHLGGFGGGYLAGRFFNPMLPDRLGHLVGAVAAIALSGLSIVASLVLGASLVR